MNKFNSQLRDWERLQERLPGGPGDPMLDYDGPDDEDRCRMEGEDERLQEEMDDDLRVAKAYHQSLNFMLDSIFGKGKI